DRRAMRRHAARAPGAGRQLPRAEAVDRGTPRHPLTAGRRAVDHRRMPAVSTAWNADRHAGWAGAAAELCALGPRGVALGRAALHPDAAAARRVVRAAKGEIVALFAPPPRRDDAGRVSEGLVSPRPERRAVAVEAAVAAGRAALAAGTTRVVLRVGELPTMDP